MASNVQKTAIARTLNQFAERKVLGAMSLLGPALPASVKAVVSSGIVTVNFELTGTPYTLPPVTVPLEGSEYVRLPIQAGCLGWVTPASAYLGGVSGLGGGTADLSPRGNLSSLVFSPLGNKNWSPTENPNALVLYGPDGVIIRDLGKKNAMTLTPTGITFDVTDGTLVINIPAGQRVQINGDAQVQNLDVLGNINLTGSFFGAGGTTYGADLKVGGDVIAGFGTGDQVGVQTHTHQYDRPTGASAPTQTVKPTAGT